MNRRTYNTQNKHPKMPMGMDILTSDPEQFEEYFKITQQESEAHNARIKRIEEAWADFLSRAKKVW
ncbi:MAG: hypothetical protein HWE13_11350 [Gammaproteobacteria bacterium]|nr:hypothetical protein [Gammaproteobacteria bacterium]NVK88717.1 hypothetical protein [Gammaproteobacteria bacterium]